MPCTIVACILAGGEGRRLFPLTAQRAKPAVRFGGRMVGSIPLATGMGGATAFPTCHVIACSTASGHALEARM